VSQFARTRSDVERVVFACFGNDVLAAYRTEIKRQGEMK
jgi:hypothetical protein